MQWVGRPVTTRVGKDGDVVMEFCDVHAHLCLKIDFDELKMHGTEGGHDAYVSRKIVSPGVGYHTSEQGFSRSARPTRRTGGTRRADTGKHCLAVRGRGRGHVARAHAASSMWR